MMVSRPNTTVLEVAGGAQQLGQPVLQVFLQHADGRGAEHCAPNSSRASQHRHEQVFDALSKGERRRIDEALQVGIQPAGNTGELCGDHEQHHAVAQGVDAHRLGHGHRAQAAHGATLARIEHVLRGYDRRQQRSPDDVEERTAVAQVDAKQIDRGNAINPAVAAEGLQVAEDEVERNAPGDGAQRQEVPRQTQGDEAQGQRYRGGHHHADDQGAPGRHAVARGEVGRGIGTEADECRLAEGGQAADAGQQHQAQRHQGIEADVIDDGHRELARHQGDQAQGEDEADQGAIGSEDGGHLSGPPRRRHAWWSATDTRAPG
jgi:hypothetical protein